MCSKTLVGGVFSTGGVTVQLRNNIGTSTTVHESRVTDSVRHSSP